LKAARDGTIVGAVSGYEQNGACLIGRLIATPTARIAASAHNCGVPLKRASTPPNAAQACRQSHAVSAKRRRARRGGDWARHELFTSERSTRNLYLYQKLGYHTFRTERLKAKVTLVYLEKINLLSDSA
jgi:hypothetical protein